MRDELAGQEPTDRGEIVAELGAPPPRLGGQQGPLALPGLGGPAGRRLRADPLATRVLDSSNPVVVLLHGLVASGDYFGAAFDELGRAGALVVPDLWGFAASRRPPGGDPAEYGAAAHLAALDAMLAVLGLTNRPLVIVGHSMGATLGMRWAARHSTTQAVVAFSPAWAAPMFRCCWPTAAPTPCRSPATPPHSPSPRRSCTWPPIPPGATIFHSPTPTGAGGRFTAQASTRPRSESPIESAFAERARRERPLCGLRPASTSVYSRSFGVVAAAESTTEELQ